MSGFTLTPVEKKPLSFALPVIGAAGAFAGLFVGTAHGSGLMGIVLGAVILMGLGFVAIEVLGKEMEKPVRWGIIALFTLAGIALAGVPGVVLGVAPALAGLVLGAGDVFWFGFIFTLAAGGDALILWLLRGVPGDRLVRDHPTKPGCLVLPERTREGVV